MDFLEIRRKAKERAASREAGQAPGGAARAEAGPAAPQEPPARGEAPARGERPAAGPPAPPPAAEAAARPEEPPAPAAVAEAPRSGDARFTTWRPGSGVRPFVAPPEPVPEPVPEPSDFAVFDPSRAAARAEPAAELPPAAAPVLLPVSLLHEPASSPPPAGRLPHRPAATAPVDPLDDFFYRVDEQAAALAALPAEPEIHPAAGVEEAGIEEYLTFRLGVEEYAVAIERVREVLKSTPVTEVPRAPAGVLGVVTVRGEVVAVFDPRRRLGLPGPLPAAGTGRIVIVDDGEGPSGLLVDAVASVVRLLRGSIEPCPQGIGGASADCLAGIGRERSRLFTVLDLSALLRRSPGPARGGGRAHAGA
jgi:purine-binding chemotaxis protein CheW